jgi:hypothetical protein
VTSSIYRPCPAAPRPCRTLLIGNRSHLSFLASRSLATFRLALIGNFSPYFSFARDTPPQIAPRASRIKQVSLPFVFRRRSAARQHQFLIALRSIRIVLNPFIFSAAMRSNRQKSRICRRHLRTKREHSRQNTPRRTTHPRTPAHGSPLTSHKSRVTNHKSPVTPFLIDTSTIRNHLNPFIFNADMRSNR